MSRNKRMQQHQPHHPPLSHPHVPYITIISAKNGDYFALERILAEFRPMIHSMAVRTRYDDDNIPRSFVDAYISQQLENELIHAILYNFDP